MPSDDAVRIDQVLDEALAFYAAGQPAPGLERRILSEVRARRNARRVIFLQWAVPILTAGYSLAVFWPASAPKPPQPQISRSIPMPAQPAVAQVRRNVAGPRRRAAVPKKSEFPAHLPLTQEEKALLAFVHDAPEEAVRMFREESSEPIAPIQIDQIEIPPLQTDRR